MMLTILAAIFFSSFIRSFEDLNSQLYDIANAITITFSIVALVSFSLGALLRIIPWWPGLRDQGRVLQQEVLVNSFLLAAYSSIVAGLSFLAQLLASAGS